jgi:hypothetical protein
MQYEERLHYTSHNPTILVAGTVIGRLHRLTEQKACFRSQLTSSDGAAAVLSVLHSVHHMACVDTNSSQVLAFSL